MAGVLAAQAIGRFAGGGSFVAARARVEASAFSRPLRALQKSQSAGEIGGGSARTNQTRKGISSTTFVNQLSFQHMPAICANRQFKALTLIEVIAVIAVMVLLIGIVLPWWANSRRPSTGMACSNHLKQVGLVASVFANDNDDKFPWQITTHAGGSREYQEVPNAAFRHFQVMSNELFTPT